MISTLIRLLFRRQPRDEYEELVRRTRARQQQANDALKASGRHLLMGYKTPRPYGRLPFKASRI